MLSVCNWRCGKGGGEVLFQIYTICLLDEVASNCISGEVLNYDWLQKKEGNSFGHFSS